jgi:hypothetical protein
MDIDFSDVGSEFSDDPNDDNGHAPTNDTTTSTIGAVPLPFVTILNIDIDFSDVGSEFSDDLGNTAENRNQNCNLEPEGMHQNLAVSTVQNDSNNLSPRPGLRRSTRIASRLQMGTVMLLGSFNTTCGLRRSARIANSKNGENRLS